MEPPEDVAEGGDAACWVADVTADGEGSGLLVEDLVDATEPVAAGPPGAVWSLPHRGDLDANLVHLGPSDRIGIHRNDEVDVLVVMRTGSAEVVVDDVRHALNATSVALIPRRARREIVAGPSGATYLSVHRHRAPMEIGQRPTTAVPSD